MPIYEYAALTGSTCPHCRDGFSLMQKIADIALEHCPECGGPVRRILSPPAVVSGQSHRLNPANIEKAGFTQYRKSGKGVYEKTAGKGPRTIRNDE